MQGYPNRPGVPQPVMNSQTAPPRPQMAPPRPPKRRHGCRNCCLVTLLLMLLLVVGFFVAGWLYFSEPTHPVEEEYETIPEYFGRNVPLSPGVVADRSPNGEVHHG